MLVCLIWKSLVCYLGDYLSNHFYFFGGDRKLMKVGLYSHHIGLVGCQKLHFEILFSFRLPIFDPFVLFFANNFFLLKRNLFSKDPFENLFQKFICSLFFFFFKCEIISHLVCTLLFSIKIWFWVEQESKFVVPNKWDNYRLNLCISIEDLVKSVHENHFSKTFYCQLVGFIAHLK